MDKALQVFFLHCFQDPKRLIDGRSKGKDKATPGNLAPKKQMQGQTDTNALLLTVTMLSEWPTYLLTQASSQTIYVAGQPINQCSSNFAPSLVAASEICSEGGLVILVS